MALLEVEPKSEEHNASLPIATWALPVVLAQSELKPNTELSTPVVLFLYAYTPTAVLFAPVVLELKALVPILVLDDMFPPPSPILTPFTTMSELMLTNPLALTNKILL